MTAPTPSETTPATPADTQRASAASVAPPAADAATHTPGPWFVEPSSADFFYITTDSDPFGHTVALTWSAAGAAQEANARLMAAAPELLEAAQELWSAVEAYGAIGYEGSRLLEAMSQTRAALAKAEGRDHG